MIQLTQSPFARNCSPVKQQVLVNKPVVFYRLQGDLSTNIMDEGFNGHDATLTTIPKSNANTQFGGLFLEKSINSYLTIPTNNLLNNINSTGITIMFWFNSKDISSRDYQYCLFSLTSDSNGIQNSIDIIKDTNYNTIFCRLTNLIYGDLSITSIVNLLDNTWYHIALTLNPTTNKFSVYLNGILIEDNTINIAQIAALNRPYCHIGKSLDATIANSTSLFKDVVMFDFDVGLSCVNTIYTLSAYNEMLSGIAKDSTHPYSPASVVLIRELPDGKTHKIVPDSSAYWEFYGTKDKVYDIVAYGPEGSMYKPEVVGPIEI